MTNDREELRLAFLEVVENQVSSNDPPETRLTLKRLHAAGYSDDEARNLIACVIAAEVHGIQAGKRVFDEVEYVRALQALPKLPWD